MSDNHQFKGKVFCPRCQSDDVTFEGDLPLVTVTDEAHEHVDSASPYRCSRCYQCFYLGYDRSLNGEDVCTIRAEPYKDGTTIIWHEADGPRFE